MKSEDVICLKVVGESTEEVFGGKINLPKGNAKTNSPH